jgi:hypothetical protein
MAGPELIRTRKTIGFPPLKECRERFARLMHFKVEWPDPDGDWEKEPM